MAEPLSNTFPAPTPPAGEAAALADRLRTDAQWFDKHMRRVAPISATNTIRDMLEAAELLSAPQPAAADHAPDAMSDSVTGWRMIDGVRVYTIEGIATGHRRDFVSLEDYQAAAAPREPAPIDEIDSMVEKAWGRFQSATAALDALNGVDFDEIGNKHSDEEGNIPQDEWEDFAIDLLRAVSTSRELAPAVAYLDLGVGGYMDVGTELSDEQLAQLPKGRHMLGIIGTYCVDGYLTANPPAPHGDELQRDAERRKARDEGHDGAIRYVLGHLKSHSDVGGTVYEELLQACGRERIIESAINNCELEFTGLGEYIKKYGSRKEKAMVRAAIQARRQKEVERG